VALAERDYDAFDPKEEIKIVILDDDEEAE